MGRYSQSHQHTLFGPQRGDVDFPPKFRGRWPLPWNNYIIADKRANVNRYLPKNYELFMNARPGEKLHYFIVVK